MTDRQSRRERTLRERQADQWWTETAYAALDRQRRLLTALAEARGSLWSSDTSELDKLADLQTMVARLVIAQCEAIARRSGLEPDDGEALPF